MTARSADQTIPFRATLEDLDGDGQAEALLDNGRTRLVVSPARGGRLLEWRIAGPAGSPAWDLFGSSSAPAQAAGTTATEGGPPAALGPGTPAGLVDHFLPLTARFGDFAAGRGRDLIDLATTAYEPQLYPMGRTWELALQRESGLRAGKRLAPLTLFKKIGLDAGSEALAVHYRIENRSDRPMQVRFGVEFVFALDPGANRGAGGAGYFTIDDVREPGEQGFAARGQAPDVTGVALVDPQPGLTVRLGWDRAAMLWVCPAPAAIRGAALRGACLLPVWELRLPPEDNWAVGLWAMAGPTTPAAPLPPGLAERIARPEWDADPWRIGGA